MRYKLMSMHSGDTNEKECCGQQKTTKKQVDQWITDNIAGYGLDWRVGYTIKFRDSSTIYVWRWIKDDKELRN